jgi:hypothetical protein
VLPETKHLKNSGFILKVKKKDRKEALPRVHAGGIIGFSLARPNPMQESLPFFSCWLLAHIKIHYINTRMNSYFFNEGLEAH